MKINLENVNLASSSGPNSFGNKLKKYLEKLGHFITNEDECEVILCFIESLKNHKDKKLFQRLDGIYFNSEYDYNKQNENILRTYKKSNGVIFQSSFNKKLTEKYFGTHDNGIVIHNGADLELIESIKPIQNNFLDSYENVWSCAASWRRHKRLKENIEYFLEHKKNKDCLVIAGKPDFLIKDPNIFYVGDLSYEKLLSLYKRSKTFLHLAWLDHCPNVVVDALACGCEIVCSSEGGTKEIAGSNATVILESEWDYKPTKLYDPPQINFSKKVKNNINNDYNMKNVAEAYINFLKGTI